MHRQIETEIKGHEGNSESSGNGTHYTIL